MRQGQQHRRGRGRHNNNNNNNNQRKGQNPLARSYESNGPDVKVRGTPAHVAEKYMSLARDALSSGDPVLAENYLQHAEHYNRIILSYREQQGLQGSDPGNQSRIRQDGFSADGDDIEEEAGSEDFGQSDQPMVTRFPQHEHQNRPTDGGQRGEDRTARVYDQSQQGFQTPGPTPHHQPPPRLRDRHDRQNRQERQDRFDRGDRHERQERQERYDRGERHERGGDRIDRGERAERQVADRGFERPQQQDRSPEERSNVEQRVEVRSDQRLETRPDVRPEPRTDARAEQRVDHRPVDARPLRDRNGEDEVPLNAGGSPRGERGEGRRRERFSQAHDQPDFLRRPVRRRRESEATGTEPPSGGDEPNRE